MPPVPAFACLLLAVIGPACRDITSEAHRASATTRSNDQACGFTIGRHMLTGARWRLAALLGAFERMLTGWVEENRGCLGPGAG